MIGILYETKDISGRSIDQRTERTQLIQSVLAGCGTAAGYPILILQLQLPVS